MRIPIIAGNWKMNKNLQEGMALVEELVGPLEAIQGVDKVLCPPFILLPLAAERLKDTSIGLGSLLLNRISAIRAFAVFSCIGIWCMLIIILFFLPALLSRLPLPQKRGDRDFLKRRKRSCTLLAIFRIRRIFSLAFRAFDNHS